MTTHKAMRSSGWRFTSKGRPCPLINYTGAPGAEVFESDTVATLADQVRNMEVEDWSTLLKAIPNVWQLIKSIPHSIPLLDALYLKCEEVKNGNEFPTRSLHCDELFCRLVWWIAYSEQDPHSAKTPDPHVKDPPRLAEYESSVQSIVRVLARQCPDLIERAHSDRRQLTACLESLGCHGLVNCSSGLIRLNDAVQLEVTRHHERVKGASIRVKDLFDKGSSHSDPSNASHQRQMNMRLTEVIERLQHNEGIESVIDDVITSHHLSSLLRIVKKRVASDKLLIGLFHAFGRASPEGFSFDHQDPVVAKLIVVFNNAYDKMLSLCQSSESDSGCSVEGLSDLDCLSSSNGNASPCFRLSTLDGNTSSRVSRGTVSTIRSETRPSLPAVSSHQRRLKPPRLTHHNSLRDIRQPNEISGIPAKSLNNVSTTTADSLEEMRRLGGHGSSEESSPMSTRDTRTSSPTSSSHGDETLRLKLHINHLKSELSNARRQIDSLMQHRKSPSNNNRLWPEPDYPDATSYYNCSSQEDVKTLIVRFRNLYTRAVESVMPTLELLPEFRGSPELQQKTVLSVIVLTYRNVVESVQRRRHKMWEVMEEGEARRENEEAAMLDLALYRHMYRRAKSQHGMNNAKEVTSQIWKTLYDFPSLKTCTKFNRFVLECVDVSWDIVAGIDGRLPRLRLEWEGSALDEDRHRRNTLSNLRESTIRFFLWPALVDPATNRCLLKATVLT